MVGHKGTQHCTWHVGQMHAQQLDAPLSILVGLNHGIVTLVECTISLEQKTLLHTAAFVQWRALYHLHSGLDLCPASGSVQLQSMATTIRYVVPAAGRRSAVVAV